MLLLFINQLSSYQRHQEVQYAVQHLWQRVKYDVTRLPPPGFLGSGVRGPASVQVCKCASVQVRKCASGDAESALDAAPSV